MDTTPLLPVASSAPPPPTESAWEPQEARRELLHLARDLTGRVPAELLVEHVLEVTRGADFAVQSAAMEATLRRCAAREQDELRVATSPRGALGAYRTRRLRSPERPYETVLRGVQPLRASCDCPDFLRNALGLCKHVLAVLDHLARRPRAFRAALATRPAPGEGLGWDPVRPLTGPGDWLAQVRWTGPRRDAPRPRGARWVALADAPEVLALEPAGAEAPEARHRLVEALLSAALARGRRRADPALRALLEAERATLAAVLDDRRRARAHAAAHRTLKRRLYPYQLEGVNAFLARGRLLLADDMGLGKTAQAIAACNALWRAGSVERALLVVPASLKPQWAREWRAFTDVPVTVVEGGPDERRAVFEGARRGVLIVNYEQLLRDLEVVRAWRPELVVLDEAQRIKNWATKTAACVRALEPRYRLVLTGTPMENRLDELASILEWVDDRALAPRWRLAPLHVVTSADGARPGGARHLDTLRLRLRGSLLRRVRRDVLDQLPGRTDTTIPVELTPEQAEAHAGLAQPIAQLASIAGRRPLTRAEFLRLMSLLTTQRVIANGMAQLQFQEVWPTLARRRPTAAALRSLASPKLAELQELITQVVVEQGRKVVVFSQWRRMLTLAHWAISDALAAHGLRAVFFTGRERQRRRTQNLVEFHDDPSARVLFATDAGGVGLNLQRAATCCVNLDLPWNPAVLEQRIGRIHRLGQTHPIDAYALVSVGSIEERIAGLVADKRALFTGLFDGASDEVQFERAGGFLSRLESLVGSAAATAAAPTSAGLDAPPAVDEELETLVAEADEADEEEAAATPEPPPTTPDDASLAPAALRTLFEAVRVVPSTTDGGVRLEAPPAAAAALATLFEGMAALLRAQAQGPR